MLLRDPLQPVPLISVVIRVEPGTHYVGGAQKVDQARVQGVLHWGAECAGSAGRGGDRISVETGVVGKSACASDMYLCVGCFCFILCTYPQISVVQ